MPFPFLLVCDLLEQAHRQCKSDPTKVNERVANWFKQHRHRIDDSGNSASALFSTLLPEKRTDRVYGIQADTLCGIVGRVLGLGQSRVKEMKRFKEPGLGLDLADCIENIFKETPSPCYNAANPITIEEIDTALNSLAARCRFSSPAVQASQLRPSSARDRDELLSSLYLRLDAREAKWLTRLILKNYQPVVFDPRHVYYCYDPLLPMILRVQDDFSAALSLRQKLRNDPYLRDETGRKRRENLSKHLTPVLGVKIHIDLSKGYKCIQIFSKSGKDSTSDRAALHGAIRDSLNIGKFDCKFSKGCILEGELVVYNDKSDWYRRHHYEHLMIVYYDVLLVDEESLLGVRHSERFKRLTDLVTCREGFAELVERQVISFSQPMAASHLRKAFAKSITARDEGLVLKPDDPYFDFSENRRPFSGCPIKLKKEYIGSFGDVGDFAVVAARYDPDKAKCYGIPNLKWTHFYLGCLDNKEDVQRFQARPRFTVVHQVELNETMLKTVVAYGRPMPVAFDDNDALILDIAPGIAQQKMPSVVFTEPLVFDVRCFSFDKEGNTGFWQPRFPQVSKVHFDRSFIDTISFSELQKVAEDATTTPPMEDSQEMLGWIAALEGADPRGIPVDAISQSTTTSLMTPSRTSSVRPSTSPAPRAESPLINRRSLPALLEVAEPALVTPPTSSAPESIAGKTTKPAAHIVTAETSSKANKRAHENHHSVARENKRSRVCSDPCLAKQKPALQQSRLPLGEVSANRTAPSPRASQQAAFPKPVEAAAMPPNPTPPSSGGAQAPAAENAAPQAHGSNERTEMPPPPQPSPTTKACEYAGSHCLLAEKRIALLSPCIAHQPWVTENLLPSHGIHEWTTDLKYWSSIPACSQSKKNRTRKICFVEHNRKEATREFMKRAEESPQYFPSGKREWVEVYDWRLLEDVTALERVLKGSKALSDQPPDPKRKWFVGLV
ncbi:DNA ligase 4 [Colletotrichum sp. SAR 10_65]|nr:DNA ligase 4 [Colletotrichum sp. SAR 10_65]KAI8191492.1 DNA ligase 4 [Colletotrichum sp. SAR 10_75]KAJ4998197.1 DNA ligase 4 [Colletotrichum sp. SAR 10_66]